MKSLNKKIHNFLSILLICYILYFSQLNSANSYDVVCSEKGGYTNVFIGYSYILSSNVYDVEMKEVDISNLYCIYFISDNQYRNNVEMLNAILIIAILLLLLGIRNYDTV